MNKILVWLCYIIGLTFFIIGFWDYEVTRFGYDSILQWKGLFFIMFGIILNELTITKQKHIGEKK
jgi:vacuolar-type H+-ATPase subunit I/STV1